MRRISAKGSAVSQVQSRKANRASAQQMNEMTKKNRWEECCNLTGIRQVIHLTDGQTYSGKNSGTKHKSTMKPVHRAFYLQTSR